MTEKLSVPSAPGDERGSKRRLRSLRPLQGQPKSKANRGRSKGIRAGRRIARSR